MLCMSARVWWSSHLNPLSHQACCVRFFFIVWGYGLFPGFITRSVQTCYWEPLTFMYLYMICTPFFLFFFSPTVKCKQTCVHVCLALRHRLVSKNNTVSQLQRLTITISSKRKKWERELLVFSWTFQTHGRSVWQFSVHMCDSAVLHN